MPGFYSPERSPRPASHHQPNQIESAGPPWGVESSGSDQRVFRCGGRRRRRSLANPQPPEQASAMGGGEASGAGAPEEVGQGQEQTRAAAYDYEGDARAGPTSSCRRTSPLSSRSSATSDASFLPALRRERFAISWPSRCKSTQPSRPEVRSSPSASSESVRARNSGYSSRSASLPPPPPQKDRAANSLYFDALYTFP